MIEATLASHGSSAPALDHHTHQIAADFGSGIRPDIAGRLILRLPLRWQVCEAHARRQSHAATEGKYLAGAKGRDERQQLHRSVRHCRSNHILVAIIRKTHNEKRRALRYEI